MAGPEMRGWGLNSFKNNVSYILYFCAFLDLLGVSMIMPLILPYARDLGATSTTAGILGTIYGLIQLISSPLVGRWSDIISRQLSLTVCLFFSACGYAITGLYSSIIVLFIGRFILGCFKHSQTISKACLIDAVPIEDQGKVLGHFNSFSSVGFIVGPVVGGHLAESRGGFGLVACVTCIVFLINTGLIWWALPRIQGHSSDGSEALLSRSDTSTTLKSLGSDENNFSLGIFLKSFRNVNWTEMWDLFLFKFCSGFAVLLFRTNFSLIMKVKFAAGPKTIGYVIAYNGIISFLSGFALGHITKRYNNSALLCLHALVLQAATLLCLAVSPSIPLLVIFLTPLCLATSVGRVASTTLTISRSGNTAMGSVMGFSQSIMAVARMMAPILAGLAQEVSIDGATYVAVVSSIVSIAILIIRPQDPQQRNKKML